MWTFGSTAAVVTLGRFYIRWRYSRLYLDDLLNGLAALCLIADYFFLLPPIPTPTEDNPLFWQISVAQGMLLWTTLWLVKASFLALCWQVFNISTSFRRAWWAIAIYTFLTYWPIFLGSTLWQCGDPSKYDDPVACANFLTSDAAMQWEFQGAVLTTALHISSDCFILALPLVYIKKLQISTAQKLSSAAVFALIIIDIFMGLTRNIIIACVNQASISMADSLLDANAILAAIEPGLAVIVCALPPYKLILLKSRAQRNHRSEGIQNDPTPPTPNGKMHSPQHLKIEDSIDELERA